jgi:hypothetical protein
LFLESQRHSIPGFEQVKGTNVESKAAPGYSHSTREMV